MELRVLRYFLTIVREEGMNKAAEVLHITQPTLSRQISQLEEELGVKLFNRESRKITLTNEGILLRRRAEEILALVDKTEQELIEQEELVEGRISIGSGELSAVGIMAEMIESFTKKYPLVTYDILTANADVVKERIEKGLIDIGILLEPIDMEKFDYIRLRQKERWVVLMCPDDPLAEKQFITAKDLEGQFLILPSRQTIQNELSFWFGDSFQKTHTILTSNLSTNASIMVRKRLGYSIAVEGALPFWDKEKITYRPLFPEMMASCTLAWKKQQPFSLAVTKFIEHIKCFSGIREI